MGVELGFVRAEAAEATPVSSAPASQRRFDDMSLATDVSQQLNEKMLLELEKLFEEEVKRKRVNAKGRRRAVSTRRLAVSAGPDALLRGVRPEDHVEHELGHYPAMLGGRPLHDFSQGKLRRVANRRRPHLCGNQNFTARSC